MIEGGGLDFDHGYINGQVPMSRGSVFCIYMHVIFSIDHWNLSILNTINSLLYKYYNTVMKMSILT